MARQRSNFLGVSAACMVCVALGAPSAFAQNKALDLAEDKKLDVPPAMRDALKTIGNYAQTVNQRINPEPDISATHAEGLRPPSPASATGAPNLRRMEGLVDPFEVSPQLRQNRKNFGAFGGLPSATKLDLRRRIQVKALLVTAHGRMAQLEVDGDALSARSNSNVLTIMDGELVDFGELGTYVAHITAREGVTLSNPGSPQSSRISLR